MKSKRNYQKTGMIRIFLGLVILAGTIGTTLWANSAAALSPSFAAANITLDKTKPHIHDVCGSGKNATKLSISIGCKGQGNPVTDMIFAIIRFLSTGAGILILASMVYAGVQYTMARDDPNKVGEAKQRIMNTFGALLIYIFAYAILNYVIPAGFFK
jgi:hypothetical protein